MPKSMNEARYMPEKAAKRTYFEATTPPISSKQTRRESLIIISCFVWVRVEYKYINYLYLALAEEEEEEEEEN